MPADGMPESPALSKSPFSFAKTIAEGSFAAETLALIFPSTLLRLFDLDSPEPGMDFNKVRFDFEVEVAADDEPVTRTTKFCA